MSTSGKPFDGATIEYKTSGGSYNPVAEITDFDPGFSASNIDMGNIDANQWMQRLAGTKDASPSLTANYVPGDAAQDQMRSDWLNGSPGSLRFRPEGLGTGNDEFEVPVLVADFSISGTQGDKIEITVDFDLEDAATHATQA